jgi:acyl-coenzyme A synthetase/AMP-(fatty) acid ligase
VKSVAISNRIGVQAWNRPELIELECALYKAGLVKVAVNARLSRAEVIDTITNAQPVIMIAGPGHVSSVASLASEFTTVSRFIAFGAEHEGFLNYESVLHEASCENADAEMSPDDLAVLH